MKNYLMLFALFTLSSFMAADAYACFNVNISGPNGRCAVPAGVPTTYTGTHGFTSSGCTFYEWEVEGGTIIGPGGVAVTDGKLCIVENVLCTADLAVSCDGADIDPAVAGGNGASVTVIWRAGEDGSLKLKVKEKGEITLSGSASVSNDISLPTPTAIFFNPSSPTSGTFTASLPEVLCPGQTVSWTINGNPAGTGNPRDFNIGECSDAVVCAFVSQTTTGAPLVSGEFCRVFDGGNLDITMFGENSAILNGLSDYYLETNQDVTSINWFTIPAGAGSFLGPTNSTSVLVSFVQTGTIEICASGLTECGTEFQKCKLVTVAQSNMRPDQDIVAEVDKGNAETPEIETPSGKQLPDIKAYRSDDSSFAVFPTLASQGQDITVQLPELNDAATIIISDMQGRKISQLQVTDSSTRIGTSDLPTGVFILTAYSGQWMASTKFVVN